MAAAHPSSALSSFALFKDLANFLYEEGSTTTTVLETAAAAGVSVVCGAPSLPISVTGTFSSSCVVSASVGGEGEAKMGKEDRKKKGVRQQVDTGGRGGEGCWVFWHWTGSEEQRRHGVNGYIENSGHP